MHFEILFLNSAFLLFIHALTSEWGVMQHILMGVILNLDPPLWSLQPSYTMPMLANGHSKTGLTNLYNGTLPRGRLEHHVATTCSR